MNDTPLSSRSGTSNPLGKRTEDVRSKIPYAIKEAMARDVANELAGSESELICEILMVHYLGVDGVLKIHEDRLQRFRNAGKE